MLRLLFNVLKKVDLLLVKQFEQRNRKILNFVLSKVRSLCTLLMLNSDLYPLMNIQRQ